MYGAMTNYHEPQKNKRIRGRRARSDTDATHTHLDTTPTRGRLVAFWWSKRLGRSVQQLFSSQNLLYKKALNLGSFYFPDERGPIWSKIAPFLPILSVCGMVGVVPDAICAVHVHQFMTHKMCKNYFLACQRRFARLGNSRTQFARSLRASGTALE